MTTCVIQVGNSDDKLTQREWSSFLREIERALLWSKLTIHFSGFSAQDAQWQNACWVIEVSEEDMKWMKDKIAFIRSRYKQDSVAWTTGETEFL